MKNENYLLLKHHHWFNFTDFGMEMPTYINVARDPVTRYASWYYFERFGWARHEGTRPRFFGKWFFFGEPSKNSLNTERPWYFSCNFFLLTNKELFDLYANGYVNSLRRILKNRHKLKFTTDFKLHLYRVSACSMIPKLCNFLVSIFYLDHILISKEQIFS